MKLELTASKIWMATEPVDFRKGLNGLSELIATHFGRGLGSHLYVFYNRRKNNLKCIAHHRNGTILLCKQLQKKRFTVSVDSSGLIELDTSQLSWLLAGLDWITMSTDSEESYDDYF
jgi:transposase